MRPTITKEWVFTTAQTDFEMEDVPSTASMVVWYCQVTCNHANAGDVSVRIGLAAATLPTVTNNSATGGIGMVLSHGGVSPGGGAIASNGGSPITTGAADADLRITCSAATGGDLRVVVGYHLNDLTEAA
jgi:hypothetical protein